MVNKAAADSIYKSDELWHPTMLLKRWLFPTALATLLTVLGNPYAYAQGTSDSLTPVNEGVCDTLIDATPGLYGLCVGFCEAQDCEAYYDPATGTVTFDPKCKPSSNKLLNAYNERADIDDPSMPCVNVVPDECPCWTEAELQLVADGATSICAAPGEGGAPAPGGEFDAILFGFDAVTGGGEYAIADSNPPGADGPGCFYFESGPPVDGWFLSVDLGGLLRCVDSIVAECGVRGF
jgi:hypothetical protein